MERGYVIEDQQAVHLLTIATVGWADVFTNPAYAAIMLECLTYCITNKQLDVHGWCLMPNCLYIIASCRGAGRLSDTLRDLKKYSAVKVLQALQTDKLMDSRRAWLLGLFANAGKANPNNTKFQFWQQSNYPIQLKTALALSQTLTNVHAKPVEAAFVDEPWHFRHSSARDYMSGQAGLLPLVYVR